MTIQIGARKGAILAVLGERLAQLLPRPQPNWTIEKGNICIWISCMRHQSQKGEEARGNEARLLGNRSRFHFIATKLRSLLSFDNCTGARTTRDTSSAVNISLKPAYSHIPLFWCRCPWLCQRFVYLMPATKRERAGVSLEVAAGKRHIK